MPWFEAVGAHEFQGVDEVVLAGEALKGDPNLSFAGPFTGWKLALFWETGFSEKGVFCTEFPGPWDEFLNPLFAPCGDQTPLFSAFCVDQSLNNAPADGPVDSWVVV